MLLFIDHVLCTVTILLHPLLLPKLTESIFFLAEEAKLAFSGQMTIAWLLEAKQSPESLLSYKEWTIKAFCCKKSTKINKLKELC